MKSIVVKLPDEKTMEISPNQRIHDLISTLGIDGRVIARKGDKIDQSFLNLLREHRLPPAERGRKFRDTYHYFNFKVILDDETYGRLTKLIESKEQVLNTVSLCQ